MRVSRIREQMQRELSDIVMHLKDPRVRFATVVDVEVARDLGLVTMYISVIGSKEEQEEATRGLHKAMGFIRREIAQRVRLRYTPEIRVVYDDTSERAARVTALIDGLGKGEDG